MKTFLLTRRVRVRTDRGKITNYCVPSCEGMIERYELRGEWFHCVFFNCVLGDIGVAPKRCDDCITEFGGE